MSIADKAAAAHNLKEAEANYFAMLLLMPDALLEQEIRAVGGIDIAGEDDKQLKLLAKKFKVSHMVMATRLGIYFKENKL